GRTGDQLVARVTSFAGLVTDAAVPETADVVGLGAAKCVRAAGRHAHRALAGAEPLARDRAAAHRGPGRGRGRTPQTAVERRVLGGPGVGRVLGGVGGV